MKSKSGPLAWVAYVAIRAVMTFMQAFPLEWNLQTARLLARGWALLSPRHLKLAETHIAASLGAEVSPDQVRQIAFRCMECVTMFAMEAICLPRFVNSFTWGRYIRLVNFDQALEVILAGRGAILVTGHYGSFELTGHLLACLGFDVVGVMRPLDNVYLNQYIVDSRRTHGLRLLDKKGATEEAEKYLDDGFLLGFIGDQDAGRKGMFVDFFGRPASTYKSIGLLAMIKNVPIIVGYARRRGNAARYEVGATRVIYPHEWEEQADPLRWITQTYTSAIEQFVREEPEQYLWIHRRWKHQPKTSKRQKVETETSKLGDWDATAGGEGPRSHEGTEPRTESDEGTEGEARRHEGTEA